MRFPAVERTPAGEFRLRLSGEERRLLRELPGSLRSLLDDEPRDPSLRRLFPPAYEADEDAEAEYRALVRDELLEGRRAALATLERTAESEVLAEEELHAWLGALNDLRLVLGTRLGVTEETYVEELDPADPRAHELAVYGYLTWLQDELVSAAADVFPSP
ncbi:MAG TPA: DUF2017 family protein [Gaiellaceae bacterium]|nr:DUF2017 family protein [Gaiellaceae bacterium]